MIRRGRRQLQLWAESHPTVSAFGAAMALWIVLAEVVIIFWLLSGS